MLLSRGMGSDVTVDAARFVRAARFFLKILSSLNSRQRKIGTARGASNVIACRF